MTYSCSSHVDGFVSSPSLAPCPRMSVPASQRHSLTYPLQRGRTLCAKMTIVAGAFTRVHASACGSIVLPLARPTASVRLISMQSVVFNANLDEALNLVGTFVFAMSGALLAVHKHYDIVGMVVLAEITAIGGGVIRDLTLGAVPPAAFTDHITFLLPVGAVALVFFVYRYVIHGQTQHGAAFMLRYRTQVQTGVLIFDAAGLAVFCVSGAAKALAYHLGPIEAIALGALTAVGGGIMRDVLANDHPAVLRADSELYAVPAVLGAAIVVVLEYLHLYGSLAAGLAAVFVFALRLGALRYGWRAPQPHRSSDTPSDARDDTSEET